MISSKKYVDETLKKYNLVANKALGQNFLVESEIASYIVDSANIKENTLVIEIGPGMGALTEFALKKASKVVVYEIDNNMVTILKENFSNDEKIVINNIDFLKVDINEMINSFKKEGYEDIVILSNLPYYITSKLLSKTSNSTSYLGCVFSNFKTIESISGLGRYEFFPTYLTTETSYWCFKTIDNSFKSFLSGLIIFCPTSFCIIATMHLIG